MARSYLIIKENDLLNNPNIFKADAFIIDLFKLNYLFSDESKFYSFLEDISQKDIKLYFSFENNKLNEVLKMLDFKVAKYISGFFIENPNPRDLRRFNLKLREYELNNKLRFESLRLIININEMTQLEGMISFIRRRRVDYIVINDISKIDIYTVYDAAKGYCHYYKKDCLSSKQITSNIADLDKINEDYTPTPTEIAAAVALLEKLQSANKKEQKKILKKNSLDHNYKLLYRAQRLNLIQDIPQINYYKKRKKEKITKKPLVIKKFYTVGEEIANAITHGIGACLAITGIVLLMIKASSSKEIFAYLVFSISALILYLMSTLYHSLALGNFAKLLFNKFDHMTIYLLIAGTYTPFSLIAIGGTKGVIICAFLWAGALLGMMLNLFAFGKFRLFHMILYVFLGWIAIFFIHDIITNISRDGVILLILGGLMYTIGIFFYSLKLFKYSHMVWHIFTLFGTVAHFLTILLYV